jgi:hypothetical protein
LPASTARLAGAQDRKCVAHKVRNIFIFLHFAASL